MNIKEGDEMDRIIGSNIHGLNNEASIVESLNDKTVSELNTNLRKFINSICLENSIDVGKIGRIISTIEANSNLKQDFYIKLGNKTFGVSCKMGTGNSVHQERISDFNEYISTTLNASKEICDEFSFFIWADGTVDGTGSIEKNIEGNIISRFTSTEYKKNYPERREKLLAFLKLNERALLERFLFVGRHNSIVDYIYHGTSENGVWLSKEEILDYLIKNSELNKDSYRATLPIGRMTLQAWNISRKGNTEQKRGEIQAKYGKMKEDFSEMMMLKAVNLGTFYGDKTEFDISSDFNKNKDKKKWEPLIDLVAEPSKTYMVKVSTKQKSSLSNRKVNTKSDAFLIESEIPYSKLLENQFILTEDDISKFEYKKVAESGISVKRPDSRSYTIQKFTKDSFYKAFASYLDNVEFVFYGNLIYVDPRQIDKNTVMANDLKISLEDFIKFFISSGEVSDLQNIEKLTYIKKASQDVVIEAIKNNKELANSIFKGKGWFEEPYVANYIYEDSTLKNNLITDFTVTTGSGRSSGKYSIIIKPV